MRLPLALAVTIGMSACGTGPGPQLCGPQSCTGCCDSAGQCRSGGELLACGSRGFACQQCALTDSCMLNTCVPSSGAGGGTTAGGVAGGAAAGGQGGGQSGGQGGGAIAGGSTAGGVAGGGMTSGGTAGGAAQVTVTIDPPQPGGQIQWQFGPTSGTCPGQCSASAAPGSDFRASAAHDEQTLFAGFPQVPCGTDALRCLMPSLMADARITATFLALPVTTVSAQRSFVLAQGGSVRQSLISMDAGVGIAGLGPVDFGSGTLNTAFLAGFDATATLQTTQPLSTSGTFEVNDGDSNGTIRAVAGRCTSGVVMSADAGVLPVGPCLGVYDVSSGSLLWSRGWTGGGAIRRVAVAPSGQVAIAGYTFGAFDLGTGPLTSRGNDDFFFGLLSPTGTTVMARRGGRADGDAPGGVAFAANGDAVFSAQIYGGPATFETISLTHANFQTASLIARYSPTGTFVSGRGISGQVLARDVLTDAQGAVYFVGNYSNTVDFGGISRNAGPGLTSNGVVVKYDAAWAAQWVSEGYGEPTRAAIAPDGSIALAGSFFRYVRWGPGYLLGDTVGTSGSGFAVQLAADGSFKWAKRLSTGGVADVVASGSQFFFAGRGRLLVGTPSASDSPYLVGYPR